MGFCYIESKGVDKMKINSINNFSNNNQTFFNHNKSSGEKSTSKNESSVLKTGVLISSAIGSGIALAAIAKRQGFSLSPKKIKNTPIKDFAIFRIGDKNNPQKKLMEIEEKEILTLAAGSILGGLAGGAAIDSKNMKAKYREALTQAVGNVLIPVGFVGTVSRIYKHYEQAIQNIMPQIKSEKNVFIKNVNKLLKNIPAIGLTTSALIAGIYTGSKTTNYINEKFFGQKHERKIKSTDFAPHVDDLCLAVTLMGSKNSPIASTITRTVPLFLTVPGYQVGKAQENC